MQREWIEILIIDDNALFRKTLAGVINCSGRMVCEYAFASCEEALEAIASEGLAPHVALLDIGLPGMSGVEGLPHLKKLLPEIKTIMLTIHDDDDNVFKAICAGASGYLVKDSPSRKILEAIEEVTSGGAPMNAHIAKKVLDMFKQLAPPPGDYDLTGREKEILRLLVDGLSKKEIAARLPLSYHTVDSHLRHIYEKLEVHTRGGAVAKAVTEKLI
jgi:DNA-binding NarL/FixJ family response regulator